MKKTIAISMTPKNHAKIKEYSQELGMSVSSYLELCGVKYIGQII